MATRQATGSEALQSRTYNYETGCGKVYVVIAAGDDGVPTRCFIKLGKAGLCTACHTEALGVMVGRALRLGDDLEQIADELCGLGCQKPLITDGVQVLSCVDAVGKALRQYALDLMQTEACV